MTDAERYRHLIQWVPWDGGSLPVAAHHRLPAGTKVDGAYGCASFAVSERSLWADAPLFVRVLAFPDGSEPITADEQDAELDWLRAWKAEAMAVLRQWDEVHKALGSPGALGDSIAEASADEARRLRAFVAEVRQWTGLSGAYRWSAPELAKGLLERHGLSTNPKEMG